MQYGSIAMCMFIDFPFQFAWLIYFFIKLDIPLETKHILQQISTQMVILVEVTLIHLTAIKLLSDKTFLQDFLF